MHIASSTISVCGRTILVGHFTLALCALAAGESIPFANYARFAEPGRPSFEEGPFPEFGLPVLTADPLPGWDENVVYGPFVAAPDLPPPSLDSDTMIMTERQGEGRTTMIARDDEGNEIGRIVADQVGEGKIDLNAANAIVNETDGAIKVQVSGSLLGDQPAVTLSLVEATGIYESDVIITDIGVGYAGGYFLLALDDDPNTSLQENILNAFQTGQFVGADIVGVWTGSYVPEPSAGLMFALGAILLSGRRATKKRTSTMLGGKRRLKLEGLEQRLALSGTPWFEDAGQQVGVNSFGVPLGDLDGDGDLDAFVSCWSTGQHSGACHETAVWLNDGDGNLTQGWTDPTALSAQVKLGDLDGDNDLDAFVTMASAPGVGLPGQVWLNDGSGCFTDSGQRLRYRDGQVRLGDLDGDGDLDAFAAGGGEVLLNDGQGNFADSGQRVGSENTWSPAALGDLDGDGDLDALLGRGSVYLNDGQGKFTDSGQRLGGRGVAGATELGDLDNDGDLDAFVAFGDPRIGYLSNEVWLNGGQGNFSDSGQRLGRSVSRGLDLGDIDGDGDLDAFVGNGTEYDYQTNRVWLNDGLGNFSQGGQRLGRLSSVSVSLGDLDGDGDLDALVGQMQLSGASGVWNRVWINTPPIPGDANTDGKVNFRDFTILADNFGADDASWSDGDFDGDGRVGFSDLVLLADNFGFAAAMAALPGMKG